LKFPRVITRSGHKATIYGRTAKYPKYRLCYMAEGKRLTRVFWPRPTIAIPGRARFEMRRLQAENVAELDALLPAVLDKAMKGEL
jgi:hypothetical protein